MPAAHEGRRFIGSADAPIVVTSCGSVVTIRNTTRAYALVVEGRSQHVRGRSSDLEVDHVEVFEAGFAGVVAKTDPDCGTAEAA